MRRAAVVAVVALALLPTPALSQHDPGHYEPAEGTANAAIGFDAVSPPRLDVIAGDTVIWTNTSVREHTVTADDASFDSGRFGTLRKFSRQFDAVGSFAYHCVLHPGIRGRVDVADLLLDPPAATSAGVAVSLRGRSSLPAGTPVKVQADTGAGFADVASTTVAADRAFTAQLTPQSTGRYRAVAGGSESAPVQLLVLDRSVAVSVRAAGHGYVVTAKVTPPGPGAKVVLQLLLPERFGWWPSRSATLGMASSARFVLRTRRKLRARVVLTAPDGATRLATSRVIRFGPSRRANHPHENGVT
jgi:plastocyanin